MASIFAPIRHQATIAMICVSLAPTIARAQAGQHVTRLGNFGEGEGYSQAVYVAGTLVYEGVGRNLRVSSFADPANPQVLARLPLAADINDLAGVESNGGQYLLAAAGESVLVVEVDNPFAPAVSANLATGGFCQSLAVRDNLLYVAAGARGLLLYDMTDPLRPALQAALDALANCESVTLGNSLAGVAAGAQSYLLDVTQPGQPYVAGRIPAFTGDRHRQVWVQNNHAYVCAEPSGLQVFEVHDPSAPVHLTTVATGTQTRRMLLVDNLAYVAAGEAGIFVLDLSQPAAPVILGRHDTPGAATAIFFVPETTPPPPPPEQEEVHTPGLLSYLLFRPQSPAAEIEGKYPLILSLHGIGERGSDLQRLKRDGLPRRLDGNTTFPFYVVSPQCPATTEWYYDRTDTLLRKLIDAVLERYPIDRRRVYVTGYSMGGIGTWDLGMRHPRLFAALAPIAARGEEGWNYCAVSELPVWAFHGANDTVIPLAAGQAIVDRVRACGGEVIFTVYPNTGHDAWTRTYANPQLYDWLLSKTR